MRQLVGSSPATLTDDQPIDPRVGLAFSTTAMSKHPVHMPAIVPRWHDGRTVIVAAPGPSLTPEIAERCRNHTVLAIKEAYRLLPWAEVMYGCDAQFWQRENGCPDYQGERWSSHDNGSNHKLHIARDYGVKLVNGKDGGPFSLDANHIHYNKSSGFQAINLAILFGATNIVLVGFDMEHRDGRRYFFTDKHIRTPHAYGNTLWRFDAAARRLPPTISIKNATPNSALRCFPIVSLQDALEPCTA